MHTRSLDNTGVLRQNEVQRSRSEPTAAGKERHFCGVGGHTRRDRLTYWPEESPAGIVEVHLLPSASQQWESMNVSEGLAKARRTGDQLVRSPLSIGVSGLVDLEPFTVSSLEVGTISVARSHESQNGAFVVRKPLR